MREPLQGWVVALVLVGGILIPALVVAVIQWTRGNRLRRRVVAARPGCVAYVVDPVPAAQRDLERLTGHSVLGSRMVLSAEATGLELWSRASADPIMRLAWSSIESSGMGSYSSTPTPFQRWISNTSGPSGTTIAFNLAGGGALHFAVPGPELPLDVLARLESTREDRGRPQLDPA